MKGNKMKNALAVFAVLGFSASQAQAAVDAAVTTSISTMTTDAATVGGLILAAIVGVMAFKFIRKAL